MFNTINACGRNAAILTLILLCSACGTSQHIARLNDDYTAPPGTKIAVGTITNSTGFEFDVDVVQMLTTALADALSKNDLLASDTDGSRIVLNARIVDYEKGDAFKRWLMPGYGSTRLRVQCDLVVGEKIVGSADTKRTVDAGGAYTIGAWQTIFKSTAEDLVKDVAANLSVPE